jgi:hypothetical protein
MAALRRSCTRAPLSRFVLSASGGSRAPGQGECSAEQDADRCQSGSSRARKDHGTLKRDAPRVTALLRAWLSRVALPDERINENDGHGGGRNGANERAPASAHNAGCDETQHRGRERQNGPWRPNAGVLVLEVPEQPQRRGNDGREEGCDGPVHRAPATVVPPSGCAGCSFPCNSALRHRTPVAPPHCSFRLMGGVCVATAPLLSWTTSECGGRTPSGFCGRREQRSARSRRRETQVVPCECLRVRRRALASTYQGRACWRTTPLPPSQARRRSELSATDAGVQRRTARS